MKRCLIFGFVAGFLATLIFHQLTVAGLWEPDIASFAPFSLKPTWPLGMPARVSLAFWGGVWGIGTGLFFRRILADGRLLSVTLSIALCIPDLSLAFSMQDVVTKAKKLANKPYEESESIPGMMRDLSYDEFRGIRFNVSKMLWSERSARFQVMLISAGRNYTQPVAINIVDAEGIQRVPYRKDLFSYGSDTLEREIPADLGYAGFKLTYPINEANVQDQFLVFAGASYFRGVGAGDHFGLSARGVALDTGLLSGEEFPVFREFWLIRPRPDATSMKAYGLLDSKRTTGAFEFIIHPGKSTRIEINASLFTRDRVELMGIAPLTSMFFHGENTNRPSGHWRPEVHDSDGLLIHDSTGEWLWRPLINPLTLQSFSFVTKDVRGFGLFQRDRDFTSYEDPEAQYEHRPDAWVKPRAPWGDGRIVLVQIPTTDETNDNIVAFWAPFTAVPGSRRYDFSYELSLGRTLQLDNLPGRAVHTFVGRGDIIGGGNMKDGYRVIVDFQGGPLDKLPPDAPVSAEVTALLGGEVAEQSVEHVKQSGDWRLSILAKPADDRPLELRAHLKSRDDTLTETWTYTLPVENDLKESRR
jgi:glucans biosynthesis protein